MTKLSFSRLDDGTWGVRSQADAGETHPDEGQVVEVTTRNGQVSKVKLGIIDKDVPGVRTFKIVKDKSKPYTGPRRRRTAQQPLSEQAGQNLGNEFKFQDKNQADAEAKPPKLMVAKFPGKCTKCGVNIPAGEQIYYFGKGRGIVHVDCDSPLLPVAPGLQPKGRKKNPYREAEAAEHQGMIDDARFHAEAPAKRMDVTYEDGTVFMLDVTEAEAKIEVTRLAAEGVADARVVDHRDWRKNRFDTGVEFDIDKRLAQLELAKKNFQPASMDIMSEWHQAQAEWKALTEELEELEAIVRWWA